MITLSDVNFRYPRGDFHLNIPSLKVQAGEKIGIIGPSGSGKTTLLNLVAGILNPDSGSVSVAGIDISSLNDSKRRNFRIANIGFIFQEFGLLDYLDVLDNILHPYRISKAIRLNREVRNRGCMLAEQMGIGDKLKRHPADLSQGERQRVSICRALLPGPKLILADEATGNLDPKNKLHILELLFENVEKYDATLLAVTHDMELLSQFDRVADFQNWIKR